MSVSDALNKSIGKRDEPGGGKQDKMDAREPMRGKLIPPAYDFGYGATWLSAATHKLLCPGSAPPEVPSFGFPALCLGLLPQLPTSRRGPLLPLLIL